MPVIDRLYPIQIQADNQDAEDGTHVTVMVHVFDVSSENNMYVLLSKQYLHVVSWDVNANEVYRYDNR